jgi:hypothetical protein
MKTKIFNTDWRGTRKELDDQIKAQGRAGYGWLSINHYGAICLNANEVFFGDIDCKPDPESGRKNQIIHNEKDANILIENIAKKYGLCFRVYQTYAGLRLIELTRKHDPSKEKTLRLLNELGCDDAFINLTRKTKTFRARLTPKPWRAEAKEVHFKRPENDIVNYLQGTQDSPGPKWQIAKYLRTVGDLPESLDPEIDFMISLHDDYCITNDERPLA